MRLAGAGSRPGAATGGAKLARYSAKRDFAATPEPRAGTGDETGAGTRGGDGAPRFVVHEHHARSLHWDLRLERDGVLASWAIPKGLPQAPRENHFAAATEDHPLQYLHFAGEIPKGQYGAGTIEIWDSGTYDCLKWEPRKVEVALHGRRVDARYALFATDEERPPKDWMIHRMDPPQDPAREPMPEHVAPMLARTGELPSDDSGWAYEIKWDGVRAIAYSQPGTLHLESRNLLEITDSYPELAPLNRQLSSHSAILDGEIVAFDANGKPSFAALQRRMHVASKAAARRRANEQPVTYMIFDLLWLDGHSLTDEPYERRHELLAALGLNGERWQTPGHVLGDGETVLQATAAQGLEGIVAKRLESPYQPGARSRNWIKIKSVARQELVVGGWLPGKGRRKEHIGALLLGVHDRDGKLRYVGRVGSGFSDSELRRLAKLLAPLRRDGSPFQTGQAPPRESVYAEPQLVAEVKFTEWTSDGSLRHPTYLGLRDDKDRERVVREDMSVGPPASRAKARGARAARAKARAPVAGELEKPFAVPEHGKSATVRVDGRELKLSNLDKTLYPKARWTKREVIDYYASISPVILAHLRDRPLTIKRWPDGVDGKFFFQKQAVAHRPDWVKTATVPSESKPIDYLLVQDLPTLIWLANLAALELHAPLSRAGQIERPTTLVFDLDPGPPATIVECCRVAVTLRGMFDNLGLESFAKTSGKKGLQLYVPLNSRSVSYEQTKPFARAVAELLEGAEPDLVVSRMTKKLRKGKVLVDWSQNDHRKTTICVYSLRAVQRPTVSTPVTWDEVQSALRSGDPNELSFEAGEVLARVAEHGDLFAPVLSLAQRLPAL
ncbi:MAG TPA: DNA ligase D [Solirubrobacteraceae bacterium]|nr:DNA ligase D [Solirubrobacteraceae bacterium]